MPTIVNELTLSTVADKPSRLVGPKLIELLKQTILLSNLPLSEHEQGPNLIALLTVIKESVGNSVLSSSVFQGLEGNVGL